MGLAGPREHYREGGAHAHLALDFHAAAMPLHDLFADGKPQARAGHFVFRFAHTIELFEEMRQSLFGNAQARILNDNANIRLGRAGGEHDGAIAPIELYGVAQKVQNNLLQFVAVGFPERQAFGSFDVDLYFLFIGLRAHDVPAFEEQIRDAEAGFMELDTPRLKTGQVEERGSQRVETQGLAVDIVYDLFLLFARHFGTQQQISGRAERSQRCAELMHKLGYQVGLLE